MNRKIFYYFWILIAFYFITYAINSYFGGYGTRPEMDGTKRYTASQGDLAMPVAILWQPRLGYLALGRSDFLGKMYSPLIYIDRKIIHHTKYLSEMN